MATAHGKVIEETLFFFVFLDLKDPLQHISIHISQTNMQGIIYHNKHHSITTYKAANSQVQCKVQVQV